MEITGKYKTVMGCKHIYSDNKIYVIPGNAPKNWGYTAVGGTLTLGQTLTQEVYDKWESECTKEGTFTLYDDEN